MYKGDGRTLLEDLKVKYLKTEKGPYPEPERISKSVVEDTQDVAKSLRYPESKDAYYEDYSLGGWKIESRKGGRQKRTKKPNNRKNRTKRLMRPLWLNVTLERHQPVTNASYGTNTSVLYSSYTGNWSEHAQCLMPCNPKHDRPCTSIPGGNCTCVPRNDKFGDTVGVCALKNVDLGNENYKTN
ncbi:hypothetical protein MRX96_048826 [Rhipicephalus microplus]